MDRNRELCELLGICWHERVCDLTMKCTCGDFHSLSAGPFPDNPDFTTDAGKVMLLREMRKREDWFEFLNEHGDRYRIYDGDQIKEDMIPVDDILDTTGQLLDKAITFLKEKG